MNQNKRKLKIVKPMPCGFWCATTLMHPMIPQNYQMAKYKRQEFIS